MTCYSIRAMTIENEFVDLDFVGRYVDDLVKRTGDLDYSIVYEWGESGPGDGSPVAVLAWLDGRWWRRVVPVSTWKDVSMPIDMSMPIDRTFTLERGQVNFWKLTLLEDGVEVGGGVGQEDDYDDLADQGHSFVNGH